MQFHHIQPQTHFRDARRIGRGGKRGTTSGRGTKGQKSRAGHKIRPALRDIIKKIPKKRGYKFHSFRQKPEVINFQALEKHFRDGDEVTPETLLKKGIVRRRKGKLPKIKILAGGVLKKRLVFKDVAMSRSAALKSRG